MYPDGSKYEGEWSRGVRCGTGTYHYPNGDWYEGGWKDDLKDGHGIYYNKHTDTKHSGKTIPTPEHSTTN